MLACPPCEAWMFLWLWLAQVLGMLELPSTRSIPWCRLIDLRHP